MTHPTTKPTQSIRERLARAAFGQRIAAEDLETEGAYVIVDAILSELSEPSKEMIEVGNTVTEDAGDIWEPSDGISYGGPSCGLECWRAMLQHIRDGGK